MYLGYSPPRCESNEVIPAHSLEDQALVPQSLTKWTKFLYRADFKISSFSFFLKGPFYKSTLQMNTYVALYKFVPQENEDLEMR